MLKAILKSSVQFIDIYGKAKYLSEGSEITVQRSDVGCTYVDNQGQRRVLVKPIYTGFSGTYGIELHKDDFHIVQ